MSTGTGRPHLSILGGGPGGLAVGYYAQKARLPFTIYEAQDRVGGNSITLEYEEFLFDSGAHRFHDKNPEITTEIVAIMGEDLRKISIPTQIFHDNKFIDFPLSPLNLLNHLGIATFTKAGFEVLLSRLTTRSKPKNFAEFAISTYGHTIADLFLLNYSGRLWGRPCNQLSPNIGGRRLKGLNMKALLTEALLGEKARIEHLEGTSFYYPKLGIGMITDRLASSCLPKNIRKNSKVTQITHDRNKIIAIELNGDTRVPVDQVISSLPMTDFLQIMNPSPPSQVLNMASRLAFRSMILVAVVLDRSSITRSATVYFPDAKYPFTRLYEPRNRSSHMSPNGKTSLVAEIPCQETDEFWQMSDQQLSDLVSNDLVGLGWIKKGEIIGTQTVRLHYAYPVLEVGYESRVAEVMEYLSRFPNLHLTGRNGKFVYSWIHNMMEYGQEIVSEIAPLK